MHAYMRACLCACISACVRASEHVYTRGCMPLSTCTCSHLHISREKLVSNMFVCSICVCSIFVCSMCVCSMCVCNICVKHVCLQHVCTKHVCNKHACISLRELVRPCLGCPLPKGTDTSFISKQTVRVNFPAHVQSDLGGIFPETQDILDHAPEGRTEDVLPLSEDAVQVVAAPLELAVVHRKRKAHVALFRVDILQSKRSSANHCTSSAAPSELAVLHRALSSCRSPLC